MIKFGKYVLNEANVAYFERVNSSIYIHFNGGDGTLDLIIDTQSEEGKLLAKWLEGKNTIEDLQRYYDLSIAFEH